MKNLIALLLLLLLSFGVAASEGIELQEANIDLSNNASLQRGATTLCHLLSWAAIQPSIFVTCVLLLMLVSIKRRC